MNPHLTLLSCNLSLGLQDEVIALAASSYVGSQTGTGAAQARDHEKTAVATAQIVPGGIRMRSEVVAVSAAHRQCLLNESAPIDSG